MLESANRPVIQRGHAMLGLTCVPPKVYEILFPFKRHFRCPQGRHFVLFCWLLVMLVIDQGKGTLKELSRLMPERIKYWALMRMVRSGWWDEQALVTELSAAVLRHLPPPADGTLHLVGDATLKGKRGHKHPVGRTCRINEYARFCYGFEMVLLVASWEHFRVPVAIAIIDPCRKGQQNILFRRMLREFVPPAWARHIVVEADAGFAATTTFRVIERLGYGYVFAVARTRKFTDGKHLRDLVQHLPRRQYRRIKTAKPDGRRRDYWVYECRRELQDIGDVTIMLSKQRRNDGPKKTKIIVTNLEAATAGQVLSYYARRWGVEVTIKELKSGLHLGRMQVTKDAARVSHSVALSVLSYLLVVRLYGKEARDTRESSLFRLKQRFIADVFQEHVSRTEQRWKNKLDKYRLAA
jgi:Transposase DDE domain